MVFSMPTLCAKEELVSSFTCKDGILWERRSSYDATISLIKVSPNTPEGNADSLRISFIRLVVSTKKKSNPPIKTSYHQRWTVTADSLEKCSVLTTYKVFIDGVYKRDSVAMTDTKYRIYGPMVLSQFDFMENNTPSGRANEIIHKGYSYFNISEDFFSWLKDFNHFPIRESSEDALTLFDNNLYLSGPDRVYSIRINQNKKIIAKVLNDRMEISLVESNRPKSFVFSRANKSHIIRQYTSEKGEYHRLYIISGNEAPYIEISKNGIILVDNDGQSSYKVDCSQILEAINLAKARRFMLDDNVSPIFDSFIF